MQNHLPAPLLEAFREMEERAHCWSVTAGQGTGSMFHCSFGEKIKRDEPIQNPYVTGDAKDYEGEFDLFIQDCAWRVEGPTEVFGSSFSSNEPDGTMLQALHRIVGAKVVKVTISLPSIDLRVDFDNAVVLRVFCYGKTFDEMDNYSIFTPGAIYTVTSNHGIRVEERS